MSLWGEEFDAKETKEDIKTRIKKIKEKIEKPKVATTPEKVLKSKKASVADKLIIIKENVMHTLGTYANNTLVIKTKEQLHDYITASIVNGVIAVDTETNNSLDPITCKLMGPCLYTPGQKNAYIPINHVNLETGERLNWQITEEEFANEMRRLLLANEIIKSNGEYETKGGWIPDYPGQTYAQWYSVHVAPIVCKLPSKPIKFIFHNGKFDYKVIKCTCGVELPIDWDTMIGAYVLNENERVGLKEQYITKIDPSIEKYSIEKLFEDVEYAVVEPELFALYAATDSYMTYRLYEWQLKQFALPENRSLETVLHKIEFPIIRITAEMELHGVYIDKEYADKLSEYNHNEYSKLEARINEELENLRPRIEQWKQTPEANADVWKALTEADYKKEIVKDNVNLQDFKFENNIHYKRTKSKAAQISDPINLTSPLQLAILFYDILGVEEGIGGQKKDKNHPNKPLRGTGEDILVAINEKYQFPICKLILENREFLKLLGTYIDKIPQCTNEKDGRIHANFHQYGAATGRFSSSDPNLQNIPSHDHTIRSLFRSAPGYILVGSDYSAQEPRMLSMLSHEPKMRQAYLDGKDLYAVIASMAFHNNYEDNLEHDAQGNLYPDGKKRRSSAKSILLGLMYGRGIASIAEQINGTTEEAQAILDSFYEGFPGVKIWMEQTYADCHKLGYVQDFWGRRRRLPDFNLPEFEVKETASLYNKNADTNFNPLLDTLGIYKKSVNPLIEYYDTEIRKCRGNKQKEKVKKEALSKGITIIDNGGKIADAERQCVNARVQGSSASLTKLAMIKIFNDEKMKDWDAHLIIGVHDELLMECKEEYAQEVADRLSYDMISAASDNGVDIPMKCDAEIFTWWYQDQIIGDIQKDLDKFLEKNPDANKEVSLNAILSEKYSFLTNSQIETFKKEVKL